MFHDLILLFSSYGNLAVFGVLVLCGLGLPIPEDITLVAGGVMAALSCEAEHSIFRFPFHQCHMLYEMIVVSMVGVLLGDSCMYALGSIYREKLIRMRLFRAIISLERFDWVQKKFERYGILVVFAARFMPGIRAPTFAVCGITHKVRYFRFFLTDGLAALISVPLWIYCGFWGEQKLSNLSLLEHYVKKGQVSLGIAFISLFFIFMIYWFIKNRVRKKIKTYEQHPRTGVHKL